MKTILSLAFALAPDDRRLCAGLSQPRHHAGVAVSAGRPVRHHRAHDHRSDVEGARPADRHRERHRRRRHHRHQPRRQGQARRLYADGVRLGHACRGRIPQQGFALPLDRFRADRPDQCVAGGAGGAQRSAGQYAEGIRRLSARPTRRKSPKRTPASARSPISPARCSIRSPTCTRRSRPIAARRRRPWIWWPAPSTSAATRSSTSSSTSRPASSRPMPSPATSARRCCRMCRPPPKPACRRSISRSGSACRRPRARRRRSSRSSTRRSTSR